MTEEAINPLRRGMIEDMTIRNFDRRTRQASPAATPPAPAARARSSSIATERWLRDQDGGDGRSAAEIADSHCATAVKAAQPGLRRRPIRFFCSTARKRPCRKAEVGRLECLRDRKLQPQGGCAGGPLGVDSCRWRPIRDRTSPDFFT
jgi:hypothetical protein